MCWMGLCVVFGLEFGLFVIARFRKLRGTNDSGWFCGKGGNCGAVGVISTLLCSSSYMFCLVDIFVLYSFICASKSILLIDDEKIPKNPANSIRATLACRFTCVCIAHVILITFNSEKRNPIKLNMAYKIVNFSKI